MKKTSSISIYREDQPTPAAWEQVQAFAAGWNRKNTPKMKLVFGEFFRLANIDMAGARYAALHDGLAALEGSHGVRISETVDEAVQKKDLRTADFIAVQGVSLDGLGRASFSDDKGMGPMLSCPRCGSADPWSRERRTPFVIQESLLKGPAQLAGKSFDPPEDGWDFVNLPAAGGVAASMRAIGWMRELGAGGFETVELVSARTQRTSRHMAELRATEAFLVPCPQHGEAPIEVCPACGTVLNGALRQGWSIRRCEVEGLAVWSRHPLKFNALHFSRKLYEGLIKRGAQGLQASGVVMACDHPCAA